jgi:SAM-dependent methyltransferase
MVDVSVNDAVLQRYRKNYGLGPEIGCEHVRQHLMLERQLTDRLMSSGRDERWKLFSECYTELYAKCPWLNTVVESEDALQHKISKWKHLVRPGDRIFEVGSGRADLLKYLTQLGCKCVATEITPERGAKHLPQADGLTWRLTDGVNLAHFEPERTYDLVISSQVVEHLHPDDLEIHFRNAARILKHGGQYIFDTPHRGTGPHDLSVVLGCDRSVFLHLKEYDYPGLASLLRKAGFTRIRAVFSPRKINSFPSAALFFYCLAWDRTLAALHLPASTERTLRRRLRKLLMPSNIWLAAQV